jgi:hypothetical protein
MDSFLGRFGSSIFIGIRFPAVEFSILRGEGYGRFAIFVALLLIDIFGFLGFSA